MARDVDGEATNSRVRAGGPTGARSRPRALAREEKRGQNLMLLGLDLGTSSVKTLVLDEGGEVCGEGSAPCRVDAPPPGRGRTHELAVAAA
jgi:hypothetical protein